MIVRARAPLRLGLAGGGTDVAPYCDLHGGFVMNAAIDKHAHATIDASPDGMLLLEALGGFEVRTAKALQVFGWQDVVDGGGVVGEGEHELSFPVGA